MSLPELSAVVPVFNEQESLAELHRRVSGVLDGLGVSWEMILVNDGSRDRTPAILDDLCACDPRCRAIHLSRNFGHQAALAAGLDHARGRAVVVLDADLQDPPELLGPMLEAWRAGHEIVYARRTVRQREPLLKRLSAWGFYRILRRLSDVDIPTDSGDFCLMDRQVVDLLTSMPERNRYVRGLRAWVGFRQAAIPYERPPRFAGEPKYTFRKSLGLAVSGVLSLSRSPLRLATWLGLIVSLASFLLAIWFVVQRLTVGFNVRGWASTTVIILFLGGVQLLTIGVIGEYLGRIYDEVKQRPLYVVQSRAGFGDEPGADR
ncbi:MAG: glycosyltransferase family 2 protein [Gemmatimonadales bacterium]